MRNLVPRKRGNDLDDILILTESEPVFTLGRRSEEKNEILVPQTILKDKGILLRKVERGGLITYHGPGQLLAYPVFNVNRMGLTPSRLVHGLESAIMSVLADFGIESERIKGRPGVWIDQNQKIASIGVAVRRGISFHGLALNYDPDLTHFDLINPCGFTGIRMTSMAKILGRSVKGVEVRNCMQGHLEELFNLKTEPWTLEQAEDWAGTEEI
jgi:lipoate-protein ligase B